MGNFKNSQEFCFKIDYFGQNKKKKSFLFFKLQFLKIQIFDVFWRQINWNFRKFVRKKK